MSFNEINTNNSGNASQAALNQLIEKMLQSNPQLLADWDAYEAASSQLWDDMIKWPTQKPDPAIVNADLAAMQQALAKVTTDAKASGWTSLVNVLESYNTGSPSPMQTLEKDIASGNATGNYGLATWDISSGGPVGSIDEEVYYLILSQK